MSEQNDDVVIRMPEPEAAQAPFECLPLGTAARIAQLERERDAATRRAEEAEHHLANLLAVIHRDGGHYQQAHGTDAAVLDAVKLSSERIAKMEEAEGAVLILYDNIRMALTAMDRCGLTAMADGIRADLITEPCITAIAKATTEQGERK